MKKKSSAKHEDGRGRSKNSTSKEMPKSKISRMLEYVAMTELVSASKPMAGTIFEKFIDFEGRSGERPAHLFYDSRSVPSPTGMRPSLMSERRLRYMAGRRIIELSVAPVFPGRFEVTGKIGNDDVERPGFVTLKGRRQVRAEVDRFGFFSFSKIDPGTYSLRCEAGGENIVIQNLELG